VTQLNASRASNGYDRHFAKLAGVDLLIIDDFGLKPLKGTQDEDFHEVIAERYERRSTIVTSNLDVPEWTGAFPNHILGAATIDRLRHGAYKVVLDGKSYRSAKPVQKTPKQVVKLFLLRPNTHYISNFSNDFIVVLYQLLCFFWS
jgi:DNA replication protein DnaC